MTRAPASGRAAPHIVGDLHEIGCLRAHPSDHAPISDQPPRTDAPLASACTMQPLCHRAGDDILHGGPVRHDLRIGEPQHVVAHQHEPRVMGDVAGALRADMEQHRRAPGGGGVEDEDIEVLEMPFAQALEMVKSGEIRDGKAVILLQYLQTSGVMNAAQVR